jgi:hypothetical protein
MTERLFRKWRSVAKNERDVLYQPRNRFKRNQENNMRYERERTYLRPNQKCGNDSRKTRRRRTGRKKDRKPPKLPTYISVEATIMTKPKNECTVFRGSELREEVVAEAVIHTQNWSTRYTVRFTNKTFLEKARSLRGGDKILVTKGRFEQRPQRHAQEFRVVEFQNDN